MGDYITLSYRWSASELLTTKSTTLAERLTGIPIDGFPRTLYDAVVVTRKLGKRYLWIDALCILQDSPADWVDQSSRMGEIYGNAWLNISADVAETAEAGFLVDRNLLEIRACEHPALLNSTEVRQRLICPYIWSTRCTAHDNILTKRGWIFQERFYSRRILHFLHHEVLWECNAIVVSERCPVRLLNPKISDGDTWKKIRRLQSTALPLDSDVAYASNVRASGHVKHWRIENWGFRAISFDPWYALVVEYSKTTLTRPADRLPAVSSLAALTKHKAVMAATYIAGLWLEDLSYGLSWSSLNSTWEETTDPVYVGPSFSWVSVGRPVCFYKASCPDPDTELQVLHYECTPASNDPFGAVESARITVRGLAKQLEDAKEVKDMIRFLPDALYRTPYLPRNVSLLFLGGNFLVLIRKGENIYSRIGLALDVGRNDLRLAPESWDRKEITII